jgi:hypothetical protein
MAKTHRGKGLITLTKNGRATCPVCGRTGVKVVYEIQYKEKTIKICKNCKASLANGKKTGEADAYVATIPAAAPAAPAAG